MKIEEVVYAAPTAKIVEISVRGIICQSGNEPMEERDNGQYGEWPNE